MPDDSKRVRARSASSHAGPMGIVKGTHDEPVQGPQARAPGAPFDEGRRALLRASGAIGVAMLPLAVPSRLAAAEEPAGTLPAATSSEGPAAHASTYLFLNAEEVAFIEAAVARLIPSDERWPGALEAGVPNYIDKQLGGAWGAGERLYRSGPWHDGTQSQGYQLPFTPAELFRTALNAIHHELARRGASFAKLSAAEQDAYLHSLEAGERDLHGVPSDVFFAHLWASTLEGFFSDPVYGGNRDMVAWRMIGFPGAYAAYYDLVDQHGIKIDRPPMSLAEDVRGHVHMHPGIPAYLPPKGGN